MGYAANLTIKNSRTTAITTYVNSVQCMYQNGNGDPASHLEYFNDATIAPGASNPASGGTCIQAKDSGTCFFQAAQFTIKVCDSNNAIIGNVSFRDTTASWQESDNTNTDVLNVNIDNSSNPGTIVITVAAS